MESSTSKVEIMKPFLFKAGIPLTFSVAAFICARIVFRRGVPKDPNSEIRVKDSMETDSQFGSDHESFYSLSSCFPSAEYRQPLVLDADLEEKILGLKGRIEDLQKRESELETWFTRYIDLKEQESMLMKLSNMLLLEKAQIELLDREISLMEDESRTLEKFLLECSGLLEQLEHWKSKSGLLQKKVKILLRRKRLQSSLIQERDLKIRAREAELLRTREELETRTNDVNKLEEETRELRMLLNQVQEERNDLLNQLELKEKSASLLSKVEAEKITTEEEKRAANELEQLKKDQEWSTMKFCKEHHGQNPKKDGWEVDLQGKFELENHDLEQELDGMASEHNDQACSKRKTLLHRLRRWVEGCEKGKGKLEEEGERHEVKCFGRHYVSYGAEEHIQGRRSCSSA